MVRGEGPRDPIQLTVCCARVYVLLLRRVAMRAPFVPLRATWPAYLGCPIVAVTAAPRVVRLATAVRIMFRGSERAFGPAKEELHENTRVHSRKDAGAQPGWPIAPRAAQCSKPISPRGADPGLDRFAAIATSNAPEGTRMFVPPKVRNAISAQGLADYAQSCGRGSDPG